MCLRDKLSKPKRDKVLADLPDIIPVWKAIRDNGRSKFSHFKDPKLTTHQIHKAEFRPDSKASIKGMYRPGFHSYTTRKDARKYNVGHRIQKFYVRKSWIKQVGQSRLRWNGTHCTVYVSSHITVKKSLLLKG